MEKQSHSNKQQFKFPRKADHILNRVFETVDESLRVHVCKTCLSPENKKCEIKFLQTHNEITLSDKEESYVLCALKVNPNYSEVKFRPLIFDLAIDVGNNKYLSWFFTKNIETNNSLIWFNVQDSKLQMVAGNGSLQPINIFLAQKVIGCGFLERGVHRIELNEEIIESGEELFLILTNLESTRNSKVCYSLSWNEF